MSPDRIFTLKDYERRVRDILMPYFEAKDLQADIADLAVIQVPNPAESEESVGGRTAPVS